MNRLSYRWIAFGTTAALALGFIAPPARAQDNDDQQRGVARISVMDGEVSVRRGDSGDWVAGVINAPLMTDDHISTGPNSRAEVEFDSSNVLRMGATAEVRLTTLEAARYQMDLAHGTVTYRILRPTNVNIEVDTPNLSVRPSKIGAYRILVNDSGETELIVRAGDVEVFTPHGSQWVNAGQMMVARGNASDPEFQIVAANPPDDWDRWGDSRDRVMLHSVSVQNVPQGVYGAEDLDNNGTWVNDPNYGNVWRPTVSADWSPYGCGRWVWEDWYGWTWVGCEGWGWAPYHYGRWYWGSNYGWLWYPGVHGVRHYWSPALVGFFGFGGGSGFGVGFGFGHVGWVPLAPYEVFHPWWGRGFYGSRGYFNRSINVTNVNITNVYRNARIRNGVTGVAAGDFQNGRFNNVVRPSGDQLRSAGLIRGQTPMTPNAASMRYSDRQVSYTPRGNQNTQFFRQQQPASIQHMGITGRAQAPSQMSRPGAVGSGPAAGAGGWRRFGEPAATGAARSAPGNFGSSMQNTRPPQASSNGNGWQRFGEPGSANRAPSNAPAARPQSGPAYNPPAARSGAPQFAQPAPRYNNAPAPRYNAPSAPAPRYSAPVPSAPRPSGGGGGGNGRSFGNGGGRQSGGGGGGGGHNGGGGGGNRHR